ncbi:MAG: WXG100 family type VII secretion target [Lachnospiraceae bacterium]|nr:WXG100 family type VII secretion target [Lachnospiraceae bacterium]
MGLIMVTASQLRSSAGELRALNGRFKSCVGQLETQEGTLGSQWEGAAKTAFHNAFMTDKGKWDEFYQLIEKYCGALEEIAARYEKAETINVDTATMRTY